MSYTATENHPIVVNLLQAAKDTGWTIDGNIATHDSCNAGSLVMQDVKVTGDTYKITYSILSISGGYVQVFIGTGTGAQHTSPGIIVESITAAGTNPQLRFYSTASCQLQYFNSSDQTATAPFQAQSTMIYHAVKQLWSDFRTFNPESGFSLGNYTFTINNGDLYIHSGEGGSRNNFYGTQYKRLSKWLSVPTPP